MDKAHEKAPMIIFFLLLLVLCFGVLYAYQDRQNTPPKPDGKVSPRNILDGMVRFKIVFGMGEENSIGIKLAVPCGNDKQRNRLIAGLPRLKDDILTNTDPAKMERWVKAREFNSIKEHLLTILNRDEETPIKQVYFEDFSYE